MNNFGMWKDCPACGQFRSTGMTIKHLKNCSACTEALQAYVDSVKVDNPSVDYDQAMKDQEELWR